MIGAVKPAAAEVMLTAAETYLARGWTLVAASGKRPIGGTGWQTRALVTKVDDISPRLNGHNVGVLLGPKSNGLVDIDLDSGEAIAVAPYLMPRTRAVFGRASKRYSHYVYYSPDFAEMVAKAAVQIPDPEAKAGEKAMLLEARCGGGGKAAQTIFPPSTHDTGEPITWEDGHTGEPATIGGAELLKHVHETAAAAMFARRWPPVGARHDAALALGGFLARCGMLTPHVKLFAEAVAKAAGADAPHTIRCAADAAEGRKSGVHVYGFPQIREIFGERTAKKCAALLGFKTKDSERPNGAPDGDDKPVIKIEGGNLDRIATEGEKALLGSRVPVFQRANELVRPIVGEADAAHGRRTKVAQLLHIDSIYLRDLLCRVAGWSKWDGRGKKWRPIDPPSEVAATIHARAGEWSFPTIAGIISTPTMRPDGTILSEEGYDEATRLLLVAPPKMPPLAESPFKDDALAALALLKGLLVEFPFGGDVDRAVALSAMITPVVRGAFAVAPMHSTKAPVSGSGKSYLFDVVAAICTGQRMPVMAVGASEEELEKRLGAALLTGQPLICIDNVNGELKGDALCQTIERSLVEIRILGKSERVRIEARGTSLFCTGNNITIVGDLCRRVITAVLDPLREAPETREFKTNPFAMVLANRGAYIAAALTVCRAYVVAGQPGRAKRLVSFEGWSDIVRSALIWLGEADFVASIAVAQSNDPERTELNELLSAWVEAFGVGYRNRYTLAEVIKTASEQDTLRPALARLNSTIQNIAGRGRDPADARRLSRWLRDRKGRFVGGLRFTNDFDPKGMQTHWWVEAMDQMDKKTYPSRAEWQWTNKG